jgi:hypothetical protein
MKTFRFIFLFLVFSPAFSSAQDYKPVSRVGFYFTNGVSFADLTDNPEDITPPKFVNLSKPLYLYGGGLYFGNIHSKVYPSIDVTLFRQNGQNDYSHDLVISGSLFTLNMNLVYLDNKKFSISGIAGTSAMILNRMNTALLGYGTNFTADENLDNSSSFNNFINLGVFVERKFDIFRDEFNRNDFTIGFKTLVYIPLTKSNKFTDSDHSGVNYPFIGCSLVLSRIRVL